MVGRCPSHYFWDAQRASLQLARESREDLVRFLERLFAADVEPGAFDRIRLHGLTLVKPLDEAPRLVWIISGGDVGREKRDQLTRKIIERDSGDGVLRLGRLFFEQGDDAVGIGRDAAVFLDRLEIADVIRRERRLRSFCGPHKIVQWFAK